MSADISVNAPLDQITISCLEEDDSFPALIIGLSGGGVVRVRVPRELPEGTRIQLQAGAEQLGTATVLYSVGSNGHHWATIQIHREDRRRDPRIAVNTEARLIVFHSTLKITVQALVADVSKSGLSLITEQPIPREVLLKVVLKGAIVFGETRYCRSAGAVKSYRIGVQIKTVILNGEAEADWQHTPSQLWGSQALAVHTFQAQI